MKKKQFLFKHFHDSIIKRMVRKHEKRCYELCPYAGILLIGFNTIHSLFIFDLNIEYGKSTETNDTI